MYQLTSSTGILSEITLTAGAAGTSAITGTVIDLHSREGCLFIVHFGAIVAGAVTSFKLQHGALPDGSDMADVAGSKQTIADTADDTPFYIDLRRPLLRYARLAVSRATQNATLMALALPYGARGQPVDQLLVTGSKLVSPVSGTA